MELKDYRTTEAKKCPDCGSEDIEERQEDELNLYNFYCCDECKRLFKVFKNRRLVE